MAKDTGKKSFLDFFKMKDLDDDEFEDDLFDDDDDDDDDEDDYPKKKSGSLFSRNNQTAEPKPQQQAQQRPATKTYGSNYRSSVGQAQYRNQQSSQSSYSQARPASKTPYRAASSTEKVYDINSSSRQRTESYRGKSEVYVIKPQEISESQTVTDFLKNGKTIVINMEGLELAPAQRIIDFIGGACYALNGSLQAISANIFIAAPESIEVSGDLREEILNSSTVSPQLGRY